MSYLVLARKYRSRDFQSLVGQEHVVQALSNALTQQRLHHAYLFTGTRGVGKTSVSRILAKALNCTGADGQGGITAQPCGVCDACRDIDSGRFVDYVELDAASNRGVEEISQLLDQAVYKPVMGRFKVYMIDEVHMLSTTAFNAMLKTLEEPPEYLKFVLATTDPQKVPPTVLSRCLQFNLRPMAPQTVLEHLGNVLAAEQISAEPGALRLLSRAARGSMRDALSLTDQAIAFGGGTLAEAGVRQMLGAVDRSHAVRLVDALAAGRGAEVIAAVDDLRGMGLSAVGTLEEMAVLLQQMAVLQAVPDALDADDPDAGVALRLSGLMAPDETQLLYSIVLHGRAELGLAPDEYSGLVMVLLRMLAFRPPGSASAPAPARPAAAPSAAQVRDVPAAAPVAVPVAAPVVAPAPAAERAAAPIPPVAEAPIVVMRAAEPVPVPEAPAPVAARPANLAAAPAPATRVTPRSSEPPEWLDAPYDDEVPGGYEASAGIDDAAPSSAEQRTPPPSTAPSVRRTVAPTQAATPRAVPNPVEPPAPPPVLAATELGERWNGLVVQLSTAGAISALTRELAMQSECVAVETIDGTAFWRLRAEREMLRAPAQRDKLQAALAELLNQSVKIEVEAGVATDSPALRAAAERLRRQAQAEQIIHNDPVVLELMQQFKTARIVPGSVKFH